MARMPAGRSGTRPFGPDRPARVFRCERCGRSAPARSIRACARREGSEMAIDKQTRAEIQRLYFAEKWKIGTIARQLGVHHGTVERAVAAAGAPARPRRRRASMIDPFRPFIRQTLASGPGCPPAGSTRWRRARLPGLPEPLPQADRPRAPAPVAEAYLRLQTLPGELAQVTGPTSARSGSGARNARAGLRDGAELLAPHLPALLPQRRDGQLPARPCRGLRGLAGPAPRTLVRQPEERRAGAPGRRHPVQPRLLDFAAHYRFLPKPVAVARGNEKGPWSAPYAMCATTSSPPAPGATSTTSSPGREWCDGRRRRPSLAGRPLPARAPSLRARARLPDGAARRPASRRRAGRGQDRQDPSPGSTKTTTASRIPMSGAPSPWSQRWRRCASSTAPTPSPAIRAASTRPPASRPPAHRGAGQAQTSRPPPCAGRAGCSRPRRQRAPARRDRQARRQYRHDRRRPAAPCLDDYGAAELEAAIDEALERGVPIPTPCASA